MYAIRSYYGDEVPEKLYQLISNFFYMKSPGRSASLPLDERIVKIRKYIQENIHKKFETSELCQLVFLSESRLLHLFKENVGIPIRNYILWMRVITSYSIHYTKLYEILFFHRKGSSWLVHRQIPINLGMPWHGT